MRPALFERAPRGVAARDVAGDRRGAQRPAPHVHAGVEPAAAAGREQARNVRLVVQIRGEPAAVPHDLRHPLGLAAEEIRYKPGGQHEELRRVGGVGNAL